MRIICIYVKQGFETEKERGREGREREERGRGGREKRESERERERGEGERESEGERDRGRVEESQRKREWGRETTYFEPPHCGFTDLGSIPRQGEIMTFLVFYHGVNI